MREESKFVVKYPRIYLIIFLVTACISIIAGIVFYIMNYISTGENGYIILLVFDLIAPLILSSPGILICIWRLEVNEELITYRNIIGIKKQATFDQINKLVIKNKETRCIYVNHKKFMSLNRELENLDLFLKRCDKENIEICPASTKPLTKWSLYINTLKVVFIVSGCVCGFIAIFMTLSYLGELGIIAAIKQGIFAAVLVMAMLTAIITPAPLKAFYLLHKQEKLFGIRFNEEMRKYNICSQNYQDNNWFIDIDQSKLLAFHKNYITDVNKIELENSKASLWRVTVIDVNGKKKRLISSKESLKNLKNWQKSVSCIDEVEIEND